MHWYFRPFNRHGRYHNHDLRASRSVWHALDELFFSQNFVQIPKTAQQCQHQDLGSILLRLRRVQLYNLVSQSNKGKWAESQAIGNSDALCQIISGYSFEAWEMPRCWLLCLPHFIVKPLSCWKIKFLKVCHDKDIKKVTETDRRNKQSVDCTLSTSRSFIQLIHCITGIRVLDSNSAPQLHNVMKWPSKRLWWQATEARASLWMRHYRAVIGLKLSGVLDKQHMILASRQMATNN